jgi:hypothetical protein
VYPPPGESLAEATIQELDDQFFTSDPFAYIRSRIVSLLAATPRPPSSPISDEFHRLLGPSAIHYAEVDDRVASLQLAVDAFALRHQVAETLLRFLHAVLHHQPGESMWVKLTDTPTSTRDVFEQNHATVTAEGADPETILRSVLLASGHAPDAGLLEPGSATNSDTRSDEEVVSGALGLHVAWINYAVAIFEQENPDLDAAHNKFKHGMGLRPQDDVLSAFTLTPPNPDGTVPLDALTGDTAVNLFDGITTEFLARPRGRQRRKRGLEVTQIAMMPAPTLVEAAAMAHTLALLFHAAAAGHFADHAPHEGRSIPVHPGLLVDGPVPGTLRPLRPFAMRFPLTTPLRDPNYPMALLYWTNGHVNTMTFGERMTGLVVDDGDDPSRAGEPGGPAEESANQSGP